MFSQPAKLIAMALVLPVFLSACKKQSKYPTVALPTPAVPADFVARTTSDGGLTLKAPASWQNAPANLSPSIVLNLLGTVPGSSVNVVKINVPGTPDMEKAIDESSGAATSQFQNTNFVRRELTTLDGQPAARIEYTGKMLGIELHWLQVMAVKNGTGYIITYTAPADSFAQVMPAVDQILASVTLK